MGLDDEQINVLKRCFDGFADEDGAIPAENVGNILAKCWQVGISGYLSFNLVLMSSLKMSSMCSTLRFLPLFSLKSWSAMLKIVLQQEVGLMNLYLNIGWLFLKTHIKTFFSLKIIITDPIRKVWTFEHNVLYAQEVLTHFIPLVWLYKIGQDFWDIQYDRKCFWDFGYGPTKIHGSGSSILGSTSLVIWIICELGLLLEFVLMSCTCSLPQTYFMLIKMCSVPQFSSAHTRLYVK